MWASITSPGSGNDPGRGRRWPQTSCLNFDPKPSPATSNSEPKPRPSKGLDLSVTQVVGWRAGGHDRCRPRVAAERRRHGHRCGAGQHHRRGRRCPLHGVACGAPATRSVPSGPAPPAGRSTRVEVRDEAPAAGDRHGHRSSKRRLQDCSWRPGATLEAHRDRRTRHLRPGRRSGHRSRAALRSGACRGLRHHPRAGSRAAVGWFRTPDERGRAKPFGGGERESTQPSEEPSASTIPARNDDRAVPRPEPRPRPRQPRNRTRTRALRPR